MLKNIYKKISIILIFIVLLISCKKENMELSLEEAEKYLKNKIDINNLDILNVNRILNNFIEFYKEVNIKGIKRVDQNDMIHFSYGNYKNNNNNNETFQIIFIRQVQKFGMKQIILTVHYNSDNKIDKNDFVYWMKYWLENIKDENILKWKEMVENTNGYKKYKLIKPIKTMIEIDKV